MHQYRRFALFSLGIAGTFVFLIAVLMIAKKPMRVVTPEGVTITLEDYRFSDQPHAFYGPRTLLTKLGGWLPASLRPRVQRHNVRPTFDGEAMLAAAFSVVKRGNYGPGALRLVVADNEGNHFDPVGQDAGWSDFYVTGIPAFPKRSPNIDLRLMSNAEELAKFTIKNPAYAKYPQWTSNQFSFDSNVDGVTAVLTNFVSIHPTAYNSELYGATDVELAFFESGVASTNWAPEVVEISDATGNHWRGTPARSEIQNGHIRVRFYGGLWRSEDAWKLKVHAKRTHGFELHEMQSVSLGLPAPKQILDPRGDIHFSNVVVTVLGLIGVNTEISRAQSVHMNVTPKKDSATLVLKANLPEGLNLTVVSIKTENGTLLPITMRRGPKTKQEQRYIPHYVCFDPGTESGPVTATVAVSPMKIFNFLAPASHVTK